MAVQSGKNNKNSLKKIINVLTIITRLPRYYPAACFCNRFTKANRIIFLDELLTGNQFLHCMVYTINVRVSQNSKMQ